MAVYLKEFSTHAEYDSYINGSGAILPNVSICITEGDVHYNPYVPPTPIETRVVAKYNVTSTSNPTQIGYNAYTSGFSSIEIDGVELPSVVSAYTFSTTGEHIVKYTLVDPTRISGRAFSYCNSLTSIDIPSSVTSIGGSAFDGCGSLTSVTIPDSVTSIGNGAFYSCSGLTSCTIGSGVTSIGEYVFCGCSGLTSCTMGSSVTSIGFNAFLQCYNLTNINIPSGVTSIGQGAFKNCINLTSVTIPDSVTSIGTDAFWGCISLISCTIGSGVTSIRDEAFQGCSSLTSIVSNATAAPTIGNNTFRDVKTNGTLYVPQGSSGYDTWMQNADFYLGYSNWTKVEQ
jgi:hypothetical protein